MADKKFWIVVKRAISWLAFIVWIGIWLATTLIIIVEELGITHVLGLGPISWDVVNDVLHGDWTLFLVIFAAGPTFSMWWAVHIYRRAYGDLSKRK